MSAKPQLQFGAVVLAALLSYGIVSYILSHPAATPPLPSPTQSEVKENDLSDQVFHGAYFFDADGKKTTLADFRGHPVLVNLWATWCPPCVAELPSLDRLQLKLKDKNLAVVAISLDRGASMKRVSAFLSRENITHLAAYWDKEGKVRKVGFGDALPVTFLVGSDGHLIWRVEGPYFWDKDDIVKKVEGLAK